MPDTYRTGEDVFAAKDGWEPLGGKLSLHWNKAGVVKSDKYGVELPLYRYGGSRRYIVMDPNALQGAMVQEVRKLKNE